MTAGTPGAEVRIDESRVRALLEEQHPDLLHASLRYQASGWDNVMFRLGDELLVRLPRRAAALPLIRNEQAWLPEIAASLPLSAPVPVREGRPGCGYPWPWSIVRWIPGISAALEPPAHEEAARLGNFLSVLHGETPPEGAPQNPVRGVPLATRAEALQERLQRIEISPALIEFWDRVLHVPIDAPSCWIHGDLHPKNVIVERGRLAGIVDWGDLCSGDRATDLAALWMLFPPEVHAGFWNAYGHPSPETHERARGWALHLGVIFLDTGLADGDPHFTRIGRDTLARLTG